MDAAAVAEMIRGVELLADGLGVAAEKLVEVYAARAWSQMTAPVVCLAFGVLSIIGVLFCVKEAKSEASRANAAADKDIEDLRKVVAHQWKISDHVNRKRYDWTDSIWALIAFVFGLFAFCLLFGALISLPGGVRALASPEAYAIDQIMSAIK